MRPFFLILDFHFFKKMKVFEIIPFWFVFLFVVFISKAFSIECSKFGDSISCNTNYCEWDTINNVCRCTKKSLSQDIYILLDNSAYLTEIEFNSTLQFISELLIYSSTKDTRISLMLSDPTPSNPINSNNPIISFINYDIIIINDILQNNVSFSEYKNTDNEPVLYLKNGIKNIINQFNSNSNDSRRKIMLTIVAGEPTQSICEYNPRNSNIYSYIIALNDGWNKINKIGCMGVSDNNYSGTITDINNPLFLGNILNKMENIICPKHAILSITEVRLPNINDNIDSKFVELFNTGHDITSDETIEFTGIISGFITNINIPQGKYVVLYDKKNDPSVPDCDCNCVSNSNNPESQWCNDAIYIGCLPGGGTTKPFETESLTCSFDTSMHSQEWYIAISYEGNNISGADYNSDQYWLKIENGYSYELMETVYNNKFGSSWIKSCDNGGTPGFSRKYPCDGCTQDSTCLYSGGGISCDTSTKKCQCLKGYIIEGNTCRPFPSPTNCLGLQLSFIGNKETFEREYTWELSRFDGTHAYRFHFCKDIQSCTPLFSSNLIRYEPHGFAEQSQYVSYLANITLIPWNTRPQEASMPEFESNTLNCEEITKSPTTTPTKSPTYNLPRIERCDVLVNSDLQSVWFEWTALNDTTTIDGPPNELFLGYNFYRKQKKVKQKPIDKGCCTELLGQLGNFVNDPFDLYNDSFEMSGDWDFNNGFGVTDEMEFNSIIECEMNTISPTLLPSRNPSTTPTFVPSNNPTASPTKRPTFASLDIDYCTGFYPMGLTNVVQLNWTSPNFNPPLTTKPEDTEIIIYVNDRELETITPGDITSRLVQPVPTSNKDLVTVSVKWNDIETNEVQISNGTSCFISTSNPTPKPTDNPSIAPTKKPTNSPSPSPTNNPTGTPTKSPTWIIPDLKDDCQAQIFGQDQIVQLNFTLLELNPPITASDELVEYVLMIERESRQYYEGRKFHIEFTLENNVTGDPNREWGLWEINLNTKRYRHLNDTIKLFATYNGYESGDIVYKTNTSYCIVNTQSPTITPSMSPSMEPTVSPVFNAAEITFDLDFVSCNIAPCTNDITPVKSLQEKPSGVDTLIQVTRNYKEYPYNISVHYEWFYVNKQIADMYGLHKRVDQINQVGNNTNFDLTQDIPNDCYFDDEIDCPPCEPDDQDTIDCIPFGTIPRKPWWDQCFDKGPRQCDIKDWQGNFMIPESNTRQSSFNVGIYKEGCADPCDANA